MAIGTLVRSLENNLGIGKVIGIENHKATVEYFCSVGQRMTDISPLASLRHVKLQRQTKCYIHIPSDNIWYTGRIYAMDEETGHYQIDLPDSKTIMAPEAKIYVRCNLPIDNPMDILAMKGHETPYFHNCRSRFVKSLIKQRSISQGMSGLLSANIAFYPHQVEVIRRILEDPIQRYLLASEVGLGKTIEAGVILRQFLLDEPTKKALIITPTHLVSQWRLELQEKFYLSQFANRVELGAIADWKKLTTQSEEVDFLIIDEAHHLAEMATSADKIQRECFEACKIWAHRCQGLLLLSGTPVFDNLERLLVMLHLLDPSSYNLKDSSGLTEKLQQQQNLSAIVSGFQQDAPAEVLQAKIIQLQELLTEDTYLQELIAKYLGDESPESIKPICQHLRETYRLHRRILRNRHSSVEDVMFARQATPKLEYDLDERSYDLHELLEQWRHSANNEGYTEVFGLFVQASGTWLGIFKQVLESRLKGVAVAGLNQEFSATEIKALVKTPQFSGEMEILQKLLDIVNTPSEDGDRLELLKILLLYHLADLLNLQSLKRNLAQLQTNIALRIERPFSEDKFPKLVIFSAFTQTAREIVKYLGTALSANSVVSHCVGDTRETLESNLNKFKSDPLCFLLVCDRSGEDGANFQFADGIIHFDLPFSPYRLEQRLGRFHRIGGKPEINSWLLVGNDLSDSYQGAWYELLAQGFDIFNNSIASLKFYSEQKTLQAKKVLLKSGGEGILGLLEAIKTEIPEEKLKNHRQDSLEGIDFLGEDAKAFFERLDTYDSKHQVMEKATEGWLCDALRFARVNEVNLGEVRSYQRNPKTLMSVDDLKTYFGAFLQEKGIYNRRLCNQYSGVNLYRLGNELIDTTASYIDWDDRGRAFAVWRHEESWSNPDWLGFRLDYLIETDVSKVKKIIQQLSLNFTNDKLLRRRGDVFFPPMLKTIYLNLELQIVEDEELIKILQRPYSRSQDYNLAKERAPIINHFIAESNWESLCHQAQETAENLLRESSTFVALCEASTAQAKQKLEINLHQLKLRLKSNNQKELFREVQLENAITKGLLEGIQHPRLVPNSVGFMIVSGRSPLEFES